MRTDRGLDRLITFLDAVVAIAITLLVLPLVDVLPDEGATLGLDTLLADEAGRFGAFVGQDVDEGQDQQGDRDGDHGIEEGDQPVEPPVGAHPPQARGRRCPRAPARRSSVRPHGWARVGERHGRRRDRASSPTGPGSGARTPSRGAG